MPETLQLAGRIARADLASAWHALGNDWAQWWQPGRGNATRLRSRDGAHVAGVNARRRWCRPIASLRSRATTRRSSLRSGRRRLRRRRGSRCREVVPIPAHDRRFRAPAWRASPFHSLRAAGVPAPRGLPERARRERRAARRATQAPAVHDAAVRRCTRADEFPGDQSRGARARDRHRRRELRRPGLANLVGRRPARAHLDERPRGVRGRTQPRDDAGQRRLPQRADRADPVRAVDADRARAAAA